MKKKLIHDLLWIIFRTRQKYVHFPLIIQFSRMKSTEPVSCRKEYRSVFYDTVVTIVVNTELHFMLSTRRGYRRKSVGTGCIDQIFVLRVSLERRAPTCIQAETPFGRAINQFHPAKTPHPSTHSCGNNTQLPLSIDALMRARIAYRCHIVRVRFTHDAHWGKFMSSITELWCLLRERWCSAGGIFPAS